MKKRITEQDYIKAHRKASREEEIRQYGHPLPKKRIHKSKRSYDRNKSKADLKRLPFSLHYPYSIFMQDYYLCTDGTIHTIEIGNIAWRKKHLPTVQ